MIELAEAKVLVRKTGTEDWRDSLDFDPVEIPVKEWQPLTRIPALTDGEDRLVVDLVEAMEAAAHDSADTLEFIAVWSDCGFEVKAVCVACRTHFPISEGWILDFDSDGDALHCGCVND